MSALQKQVGALVRRRRMDRNLTQSELATKTGRSVELIGRIERGTVSASLETLEKIARALRVPVRDLFGAGPYAAGAKPDPLGDTMNVLTHLNRTELIWVNRLIGVALLRK